MHPDEAALLKAVCAAPDDDLPRLVYADWLDEQGRHIRADFIRSQIELTLLEDRFRRCTTRDERKANGPEFGRRLSVLRRRVKELLEKHREEATGVPEPVRRLLGHLAMNRGFISAITIGAADVNRLPDWLGDVVVPCGEVVVDHAGYHLTPETDHPLRDPTAWDRVTHLRLHDRYWHTWQLPEIPPEHLARLAELPLTRVTTLDLERCRMTDDHAAILAEVFDLPALRALNLRSNPLTPNGVLALSNARWWVGLHELSLSCSPPLAEAIEVLSAVRIAGLRSLTLGNNHELTGRVGRLLMADLAAAYPSAVIRIT